MGRTSLARLGHGPFSVADLSPGDRYELSEGHPIYCAPAGGDHAKASSVGALVIDTDPDVESTGVDAGYALSETTMRAPDISVGVPDKPGWVQGVPPLAIEYAARGQDEAELKAKIREFLAAGTRWVWVVRLTLPRCVEVHETRKKVRKKHPGDLLEAPGILRNPVRVEALFDRRIAKESALQNLLQEKGYASLDEVRDEGIEKGIEQGIERGLEEGVEKGKREAIVVVLQSRGVALSGRAKARILRERDSERVNEWLRRAAAVTLVAELFREGPK